MYKFTPSLVYKINGQQISSNRFETTDYTIKAEITDGAIKCVLIPNKEMELVRFTLTTTREMGDKEAFFANGFQSWSTSPEVYKNTKQSSINPLANISKFTYHLATMSGDYQIIDDYGKEGCNHSFTYTYFRNGDELELLGSMSERVGYTIFAVDASNNSFKIIKDVEGLVIKGETELLNVVRIMGEYDEVFDKYFGSMNLRKPKANHLSGYTSWYNYFQKIDENIIIRDLNGLDKVKESVNIFQIDDGYETFVGDWLTVDSKKFPRGMKYIAEQVHNKGYLAGIWIAPFSAQRTSVVAKEHPDWLIKNPDGKPQWGVFAWGGAYTLDMYNPGARAYIKNFFDVILRDWGYDMVKLDFLYSQAITPRKGKSRGMIMCEALDFLRECVGEDKLFLGCGVPLGPSFGVVDACRVGCDVDLIYNGKFYNKLGVNREVPSAQNSINNAMFRRHLNGRVFCNDPDVFFLRYNNLTFTQEQKRLLGTVNHMFGDVLFVSDNAGDYGASENEMVKQFFAPCSYKIKSAYMTEPGSGIYEIKYEDAGTEKTFKFEMATGKIL